MGSACQVIFSNVKRCFYCLSVVVLVNCLFIHFWRNFWEVTGVLCLLRVFDSVSVVFWLRLSCFDSVSVVFWDCFSWFNSCSDCFQFLLLTVFQLCLDCFTCLLTVFQLCLIHVSTFQLLLLIVFQLCFDSVSVVFCQCFNCVLTVFSCMLCLTHVLTVFI